ncbi:MAG: hypothetical protein JNK53_08670, partial [Phycisphaerae bacterium]|nr:hypothetical protein [Phycisphaerae bacterium]
NQVSQAHGQVDSAAANAMSALGSILTGGHPAMTNALLALDALEQALGAIVAQYGNFQNVAGQQPGSGEMAGFHAQGAAALQALLDAISNAQQASANAAAGAGSASDASAAASAVRDLALQLAERFGLDMNGALAAAAQAYAEALSAGGASNTAANYAQQAQALALLAHADALGNIAAQIDALLGQTGNLSAAAQAELNAAQASYVAVNEYGTGIFASLTQGESNGAFGLMQGANQSMNSLQEMASTSTAYVAALDGAENAAKGAEFAEKGARKERRVAERHAHHTEAAYGSMTNAINSNNFASAVAYGNGAVAGASLADAAANNSAGYAQQASNYYTVAQQHGQTAENLQAIINQYGANSAQYAAAAASFAGDVQGANATMQEISARADFYNDVAQMLAGRANTGAAAASAQNSGDAHAQVMAIAAQLAASAQNAAQLEQTARSNAERMFYRSARQYVERAGGAAHRALNEAQMARAAADHAAQIAEQAAQQAAALGGQTGGNND